MTVKLKRDIDAHGPDTPLQKNAHTSGHFLPTDSIIDARSAGPKSVSFNLSIEPPLSICDVLSLAANNLYTRR